MAKLLSALVGMSMFGLVSVASAAEPVLLSEAQLDSVAAGTGISFLNGSVGVGSVNIGNTVNVITVGLGSLHL